MLKLCRLMRQSWFGGEVIGCNPKRGPSMDYSIKVWSQLAKQFHMRRFLMIFWPNFLFLAMVAILVGYSSERGPPLPRLVQIGPVVSEEKIKMPSVRRTMDGRRTHCGSNRSL